MDNCDFSFEKLMDAKKEILESKPDFSAEAERIRKNSEDLAKMSLADIEKAFFCIYMYNYGYM